VVINKILLKLVKESRFFFALRMCIQGEYSKLVLWPTSSCNYSDWNCGLGKICIQNKIVTENPI